MDSPVSAMRAFSPHADDSELPEVSVVIPCLNEAESLGICVEKAWKALQSAGINGEVIVADNGSTDGSQSIATRLGARVVDVPKKGYGNALQGGINAARGKYIIMGDADDSYDFLDIPRFVGEMRKGFDLVQGCRLPSGGGQVLPGAMPPLHRWVGNPALSFLARTMFHAPVHDIYCGYRAFSKALFTRRKLTAPGMEFATEMIIKSALYGEKISEIPITLHPDARKTQRSHLRTFSDGWRTLRFFLLLSPSWLFSMPGLFASLLGVVGYVLAMPRVSIHGITFDLHTLLCSSLCLEIGLQITFFWLIARAFAAKEGLLPDGSLSTRLLRAFRLERGLVSGVLAALVGVGIVVWLFAHWRQTGYGALQYPYTMRRLIPAVTLIGMGIQAIFSSFLLAFINVEREKGG